jgi:hypothetical protein
MKANTQTSYGQGKSMAIDNTVYATLERGSTEWLARILEPGKQPAYFVPSGIYHGIAMSLKSVLCKAVNDTYSGVTFVSDTLFNLLVKQADKRLMALPDDWPEPTFQIGQCVYVVGSDIHEEITGIFRDEQWEDGVPDSYVLRYRVLCQWYTADELSADPPASQMVSVGDALQEDGLFLEEDIDLP